VHVLGDRVRCHGSDEPTDDRPLERRIVEAAR